MKTVLRNLLSIFRRFKMATILNILGLSFAFTAFIIITIQVQYERDFDRCYETSDRLFRASLNKEGIFATIMPRAFVEDVIQSSPHIVQGTLLSPAFGQDGTFLSIDRDTDRFGFKETVTTCHANLPEVFAFEMLEGSRNCLYEPGKIMIPASMARMLFGNEPALNRTIYAEEPLWTTQHMLFTIGGVYRDLPDNTQLNNVIYTQIDPEYCRTNYDASNWPCFLLLDSPESADLICEQFNANYDFNKIGYSDPEMKLILRPLPDVYYLSEDNGALVFKHGNRKTAGLLLLIALMIICVAAINYTNFSTSLTPMRVKSINTQKVLGSADSALRRSLVFEAMLISLFSWLIALLFVAMLNKSGFLAFLNVPLTLKNYPGIICISGAIALLTGLLAGIYPAYYMTSFPPALVLKGSFGLSPAGRRLRTTLISIQFIVTFILISCAFYVQLQNHFIHDFSLGFEKDQVITLTLSDAMYTRNRETLKNRLTAYPGIEGLAFSSEKLGARDSYSTNGVKINNEHHSVFTILVSPDFMQVMGIPVIEGRDFTETDLKSEKASVILNRRAREALNLELGKTGPEVENQLGHLIGFTDHVKFSSLRKAEDNIVFVLNTSDYALRNGYVRLAAGINADDAVAYIRQTIHELDPIYPESIEFYDTLINNLYQSEHKLKNMVVLFSVLAILLSLIGVFGLVVFDTQYRRKEIAIRKVHGAGVGQILLMFNKAYLKIVCICCLLAIPVAIYAIQRWQEGFAYKMPVYWWIFVVTFLIVGGLTLLIVNFQNWKAAHVNPAESLNH